MKTISRYIMTLALLLTAVGGAWAGEEPQLLTTIFASSSFLTGSQTFDDIATVTFGGTGTIAFNNGWIQDEYNKEATVTVTAVDGYTITSIKLYDVDSNNATISTSPFTAYLNKWGATYVTTGSGGAGDYVGDQVAKIEVYGYKSAPAEPDVEVTTNAAEEGATFTEATFAMPAFDVTADYELVRDMSVQMQAQVGDGTQEQPRYRVKKDGNKFIPADMEMAAVPALFTVNDAIEQKALTQTQDYIVQIYAIDAEGQPIGQPMTFATFTFEPGIYAVKAVAAQGSDYDGETALSNTFQLYEGYDLTVKPANDFSKGKVESVTVGTGSVTIDANTGEATKTDIAPDTEVKIKAKRGYVIDKVEVKKKAAPTALNITNPAVGQVIGSDGKNYAYGSLPTDVTAVAKVCYVDGNGHGLALALTDEGQMNWSTAIETCAAHTPAFTGGTWKLASKAEWGYMISAAGSYGALRDGFSSVGGTNMQSGVYFSSTEYDSYYAWLYYFNNGFWDFDSKNYSLCVRACLAF